jgi:hypothetical protein
MWDIVAVCLVAIMFVPVSVVDAARTTSNLESIDVTFTAVEDAYDDGAISALEMTVTTDTHLERLTPPGTTRANRISKSSWTGKTSTGARLSVRR